MNFNPFSGLQWGLVVKRMGSSAPLPELTPWVPPYRLWKDAQGSAGVTVFLMSW